MPTAAPVARTNAFWKPNGASRSLRIAQQIQQYTQGRGVGIVEFAIAWVLNNSAVTSAIVGPRTEEQWDAYTKAQAVKITAEDEAFIDSLVTPGHASTPGFNDVSHFVSGRKPRKLTRTVHTPVGAELAHERRTVRWWSSMLRCLNPAVSVFIASKLAPTGESVC